MPSVKAIEAVDAEFKLSPWGDDTGKYGLIHEDQWKAVKDYIDLLEASEAGLSETLASMMG